ncbi:DNA-binding domain-containing protein [Lysobacter arvi]|uniref:DNA-binding domain-containing protein n=1 Tax=Lysobacter arvi TaxID=3038776 RepID=A0ABU1CA15_9GAMM|nr:putative DNA-binding domain-containing protein [Lysobacter arvi]MDR0182038.1 putative DNA-binding domain-containing protein [Lysobacter arvi]
MQPEALLREQQFELARHIRDPERNRPPPGLQARRLKVYRELFFNAIEGLLAGGFPVIRETLGTVDWRALVRAFYADHRSRTPLFTEIAMEFVAYLAGRADDPAIPPWLPELAHYEWVEQALFVSDAPVPAHDPHGDLLDGVPVLSPLAVPLIYRWPVTDIGPQHRPDNAPDTPTTLLVHRDAEHHVHFTRLSPLAYSLLESLAQNAWTGRAHLAALASRVDAEPAALEPEGLRLLRDLRERGVVPGIRVEQANTTSAA